MARSWTNPWFRACGLCNSAPRRQPSGSPAVCLRRCCGPLRAGQKVHEFGRPMSANEPRGQINASLIILLSDDPPGGQSWGPNRAKSGPNSTKAGPSLVALGQLGPILDTLWSEPFGHTFGRVDLGPMSTKFVPRGPPRGRPSLSLLSCCLAVWGRRAGGSLEGRRPSSPARRIAHATSERLRLVFECTNVVAHLIPSASLARAVTFAGVTSLLACVVLSAADHYRQRRAGGRKRCMVSSWVLKQKCRPNFGRTPRHFSASGQTWAEFVQGQAKFWPPTSTNSGQIVTDVLDDGSRRSCAVTRAAALVLRKVARRCGHGVR